MNAWSKLLAGLATSCLFALGVFADEADRRVQVAIEEGSHRVWYDSRDDALVFPPPTLLQSAEDDLKDRHRYLYDDTSAASTGDGTSWLDWFTSIGNSIANLARSIVAILIAAAMIGIVVYLWYAVDRGVYVFSRRNLRRSEDSEREQAKIVDLPFNIDMPARGLLQQAEAFRDAGDYSRAIVYLFSHVLVELDDADCIRLQRGKTNRVYLRELKDEPRLSELHRYLMQVFEAVFFGRYVVSRETCDHCWSLLPSIQRTLEDVKQRRTSADTSTVAALNPSRTDDSLANGVAGLGLLLISALAGCGFRSQVPTDAYGNCSDSVSRKSVSGLSVFRALCQENGLRAFELNNLSQRSKKLDAILWAPKDYRVPSEAEMQWFDEWLSGDTPRTLIFVGRDYSPAAHYWQQAAAAASSADRRSFRLQQAYLDAEMEVARSRAEPDLKCGWFYQQLEPAVAHRVVGFGGPWSKGLMAEQTNVVLRGSLKPNRSPRAANRPLVEVTASATSKPPSKSKGPLIVLDADHSSIDYGVPKIQTLLKSGDGTPIVSSISYEPWGASRLLLVANGSILMNESFASKGNRQLAERLMVECVPKGRIGFLSNVGETRIRNPWDDQEPKGFELLRVWPLSLISMQGLFLGFVALLAMLPIFGRPQRLASASTTDFGKHIEALGELLLQSRDRNYALHRIADYFRDVRRDVASPWARIAPQTPEPERREDVSASMSTTAGTAPTQVPVSSEPVNTIPLRSIDT